MLMATPALAGEVCTDGDSDCVSAMGLMQKDSRTSQTIVQPAAGPAAAGPAAAAPGAGVESLYKLAESHVEKSKTEMDRAELMGQTEDDAAAAAAAARNKAEEAGEASVAYAFSSGTHKEASDLAAEASEARAKAIKAIAEANAAKEKYDKMSGIETRAMEAASAKAKEVKKATVLRNTKALQVKQLKASLSEVETKCAGNKEAKKATDDSVDMAKRELQNSADHLSKMTQAAQAAKNTWDLAVDAADKANAEATRTMDEQTAWSIKLGQEQAESAKIGIEESLAEKERELARNNFDAAQATAHSALETATQEEAEASAAVTVANGMISRAKALADKVPIAAGPAR